MRKRSNLLFKLLLKVVLKGCFHAGISFLKPLPVIPDFFREFNLNTEVNQRGRIHVINDDVYIRADSHPMNSESEEKDTDNPCDCNTEPYFLLIILNVFKVASVLEID